MHSKFVANANRRVDVRGVEVAAGHAVVHAAVHGAQVSVEVLVEIVVGVEGKGLEAAAAGALRPSCSPLPCRCRKRSDDSRNRPQSGRGGE